MTNLYLLILILTIITFISRVFGVSAMANRQLSPMVQQYFTLVPIAVMAALITNQIITVTDKRIGISVPALVACFLAAVIMKITNRFLPAVLAGLAVGLVVRHFFIF